jgi:hypothetical protein
VRLLDKQQLRAKPAMAWVLAGLPRFCCLPLCPAKH